MKAASEAIVQLVEPSWLAERIGAEEIVLLDPRAPIRYLSGHLQGAVNVPWRQAFGPDGQLRLPAELAAWLEAAGVDEHRIPVVYDDGDGRQGALLAWILLYLGRRDVHLLNVSLERWRTQEGDVFYRPVEARRGRFRWQVNEALLGQPQELLSGQAVAVDFRSCEEYAGTVDTEGCPGHIPGAVHLSWQELAGPEGRLLAPAEQLAQLLDRRGIPVQRRLVAYCRSGLRAALGCLALRLAGCDAGLYVGSFADWVRCGHPVERAAKPDSRS
jgi:thiosulfate/3-mercaptopyruvate sulfurtransferase